MLLGNINWNAAQMFHVHKFYSHRSYSVYNYSPINTGYNNY